MDPGPAALDGLPVGRPTDCSTGRGAVKGREQAPRLEDRGAWHGGVREP
jgi:hypothetical protein